MSIDFSKYPFPATKIRHHLSTNMYLPLDELKIIPEFYPPLYKNIDWSEHFDNSQAPTILDIGSGKGLFLLNYSLLYPNKNILGIEVREVPVNWLKGIINGENLPNCSILRYSIANKLPFLGNNSIEQIFYLFPDPWPKQKHKRRKVLNNDFLAECKRVLKSDGVLVIATDCDYVHEEHLKILSRFNDCEFEVVNSFAHLNIPITNKEKFCLEKNIEIFRIICNFK